MVTIRNEYLQTREWNQGSAPIEVSYMNKVKKVIIIFIVSAIVLIGLLAIIETGLQKKSIMQGKGTVVFYYGITCPHCKIVEYYIHNNKIESSIQIMKKEVYENPANALELQQAAKDCNISGDQIGVPFLVYNNSCYIGDADAINLLKQLAGVN